MRLISMPLSILILSSALLHAGCVSFADAAKYVGKTRCVTGKLLRIDRDELGITRLDFCEVLQGCPFTAIVFAGDIRKVGDLQQLQGKNIEIRGLLKNYAGATEIVVSKAAQLFTEDEDAREETTSLLRAYDVEEKGHYSAGTSRAPRSKRVTTKKQTATLPIDVPVDSGSAEDQ